MNNKRAGIVIESIYRLFLNIL